MRSRIPGNNGSPNEFLGHLFFSYHFDFHQRIGDAALKAGNSEGIVKRHYFNTQDEGSAFSRSVPDLAACKAPLAAQPAPVAKKHLKVV